MPREGHSVQDGVTMDIAKAKAETLSKRLNKIANSLEQQCHSADELEVKADDLEQYAKAKLPALPDEVEVDQTINIQMMMDDFAYVRGVLRENTECARAMLEHVSGNMLDEDDNVTPSMLTAFSELNKSITENMRLYVSSYKDLSTALANLRPKGPTTANNTLNIINPSESITSVKDMIERLKGSK